MNKSEFRDAIYGLITTPIDGLSWDERISVVMAQILKAGRELDYDVSNKGKSWTDDELRLILKSAPTKENCLLFARAFKRGYGSIEQIYRWAAEDQATINEKRPNDSFIKQIKRIAYEVGWRAT